MIDVPHDPSTGLVSPFQINATLGLFTSNILFPTGIQGLGSQITQANVKPNDIFPIITFNYPIPVATTSLEGQHFLLYWNNGTSGSNEKLL
jgi:hypothetical protein